jgi:ferric iron reductase protein FhuF
MEPSVPPHAIRVPAAAVTAAVEDRVSYLRIGLSAPPEEGWISAAALVADRSALLDQIRTTGAGRGVPDDQVAASLWFQAYAFRAALPVLAPAALGLPGLRSELSETWIRIARNRPAAVAVTSDETVDRSAAAAARDLVDGHLALVVDAVAGAVTVGRRLLWGNAAASCATVLRALESAPGADQDAVRRAAGAFFAAADPWLTGLGRFEVIQESGHEGWYWTRTNCCLWDRCDGASRCDDCSLIPVDELEAARRSSLRAIAEEVAS